MSYLNIAEITQSESLRQRLHAAAAEEGKGAPDGPEVWVASHIWQIASSPGWGAAWGSALAGGVTDPGMNEAVISDAMILAVVQPME
jgi:hypothetical protein